MISDTLYQWFVQATAWAGVIMLALSAWALLGRWVVERRQNRNSRMRARMQEWTLSFLAGQVEMKDALAVLAEKPRLAREVLVNLATMVSRRQRAKIAALASKSGVLEWARGAMNSHNTDTRVNGAIALGYLGSNEDVPLLMSGLYNDHLDLRIAAAQALVEMRHEPSIPAVVHALAIPGRWTHQRSIELLSGYGPEVVPALLGMLRSRRPDPPASVARIVLGVIGRIAPGGDTALHLVHWASHKDIDTRVQAVRALGAIADPVTAPTVASAIADESWEVRAAAAKAMARFRGNGRIDRLVAALADRNWWVRHHAASSLSQIGQPGLAALENAAQTSSDAFARDISKQIIEESHIKEGVPA